MTNVIRIMGIALNSDSPNDEAYITHYFVDNKYQEKEFFIEKIKFLAQLDDINVYVGTTNTLVQIVDDKIRGRYLRSQNNDTMKDNLLSLPHPKGQRY